MPPKRSVDEQPHDCPICLDSLYNGNAKKKLVCGHEFHTDCIDGLFTNGNVNATCPLCRKVFPKYDKESTAISPELQAAREKAETLEISVRDAEEALIQANEQLSQESRAEETARVGLKLARERAKREAMGGPAAAAAAAAASDNAEKQVRTAEDISIRATVAFGLREDQYNALKKEKEVHLELLGQLEKREEERRKAEIAEARTRFGDERFLENGLFGLLFRGGSTRRGRRSNSRRSKSKKIKKSKQSKITRRGKTRRINTSRRATR